MRRLLPLLGTVLVLALTLAGTAGADTFRVATPQQASILSHTWSTVAA